jgi:hypothetical protein
MAALLEYGRSRMRICRGWALNSLVAVIPVNLLFSRQERPYLRGWIFLNVALLLLAFLCWYCWRRLADTEYRKLRGADEPRPRQV